MSQTKPSLLSQEFSTATLTEDDRHEILAAEERRLALDILWEERAGIGLEELAAAIVTRKADVETADADSVKQIATVLHHMHLPKMADVGIIHYDTETHVIEVTGSPA